jgi:hypothetical protein
MAAGWLVLAVATYLIGHWLGRRGERLRGERENLARRLR